MKLKKNPKADLNKNSGLFFIIGLVLVLFITWRAIENKTYEKIYDLEKLNVDDEDDDEIPLIDLIKPPPPPPPPPPPQAPTVIEIVDDEEEVEETVIETTETDDEEIIEDIEIEEVIDEEIPFAIIEDKPIFPGCEKVKKSELAKCFQDKINKHIRKNFRYPEIAKEMGIQGRVFVQFVIDKKGHVEVKAVRSPDKSLEKEARRIISLFPKMKPGKQRGVPVRVPYSIPITFRLQ